MKTKQITGSIAVACFLCTILVRGQDTSLPDGFYLEDKTGNSSYQIKIQDEQGLEHKFAVKAVTNFVVKSVSVYSLEPSEELFQVQVNVVCTNSSWTKDAIALVIQNKPYFELSKTSSIPGNKGINLSASISLKVPSRTEAELIRNRLIKKFELNGKKSALPSD